MNCGTQREIFRRCGYRKHLGMNVEEWGGVSFQQGAGTFACTISEHVLGELRREGVKVEEKTETRNSRGGQ